MAVMRLDELPSSDRIEDRRGLTTSRAGIGVGTVVVLGLIGWALGIDPLLLIGRRAGPLAAVNFRALDPVAECLGIYAEPLADPGDRPARLARLRPQLEDHRHRAFPQLSGMTLP